MVKKKSMKTLVNISMWILAISGILTLLGLFGFDVIGLINVPMVNTLLTWAVGISGVLVTLKLVKVIK